MTDKKTSLNTRLRQLVRLTAYPILLIGGVFKIAIPWATNKPLYLDKNDGYAFISLIVLVVYIEAIKVIVDAYSKRIENRNRN